MECALDTQALMASADTIKICLELVAKVMAKQVRKYSNMFLSANDVYFSCIVQIDEVESLCKLQARIVFSVSFRFFVFA